MKNDTFTTGNYYTIGHVAVISGLSDRTIRNYIALDLLQGEKINGLWHFTPEQVEAFLHDPTVRPSILAKHNAIVLDFLRDTKKKQDRCCIVLDLPESDPKQAADHLCCAITEGDYHDLRFAFDGDARRIILSGTAKAVLALATAYDR